MESTPASDLRPVRLAAAGREEDRGHADALRPAQLVVRAVADEERVAGLDAERVERRQVDLGVGLDQPAGRREGLGVEETGELGLRPDRRDVFGADRDQPELDAALAKRGERLSRSATQP